MDCEEAGNERRGVGFRWEWKGLEEKTEPTREPARGKERDA